ncbi:MAG TPA: B12-binding domain-containing radical SAM protein [Desulfobacterales bacterium]|nr:B12-binding domain-containing radical SAM protein [Desulfobacterales bacterium]
MRVLLLNPAATGTFHVMGIVFPPLGLLYVAAAVRDRGYEVEVVDRTVDFRKIDFASFDVVGIHSDTTRFKKALELARRANAAGAKVVMGGPHPCFVAREILATGVVDAVVRGEGDKTFADLLDAWKHGSGAALLPGLTVATSQGVVDTGDPVRIRDVDSLPFPARDLIDLSRYTKARLGYRPLATIHTSRGCPYRCRFCSSSRFDGAKWRARSSESVLAELEHLVGDLGYKAVAFVDDNFAGSPERIHKICDGILKKGLDIHWWCFCRVDTVAHYPEMVQHMAEAGARSVFIGVETSSSGVLDHFHKGISAGQAREAVRILKRNGIKIWASYILGAPEETRTDIRSTIRFACELDSDIAQFTLLTPYPGTELYEELKDTITEKDWSKFDGVHAVYQHPRIPRVEMQMWHIGANAAFCFRHRRSAVNFFRFLANRNYGAQLVSRALGLVGNR